MEAEDMASKPHISQNTSKVRLWFDTTELCGFVCSLYTFFSTTFFVYKGRKKRWVNAQAHLPTATKNYAVCSPRNGMSTTQQLQEVQATVAR